VGTGCTPFGPCTRGLKLVPTGIPGYFHTQGRRGPFEQSLESERGSKQAPWITLIEILHNLAEVREENPFVRFVNV
jgi:hypothetical protein